MDKFDRLNRRTHLYLGLILIPWVILFGISSFVISHHATWFKTEPAPIWEPVFEKSCQHPVPDQANQANPANRELLRVVAREILKEYNLEGAFHAERPNPGELRIVRGTFFDQTRLIYTIEEQRLRAERQQANWDHVVLRMHFRNGHDQPLVLNKLWAIAVDTTCIAILLWVISGVVMWWRMPSVRAWGSVALAAGILTFLLLTWNL